MERASDDNGGESGVVASDSEPGDGTQGIGPGETVYDSAGQPLGRVVGTTEDGFEVETVDPDETRGEGQEELPGQEIGEGYLMWRCGECGTMGELDEGFPSRCPNCDAPEEALEKVTED